MNVCCNAAQCALCTCVYVCVSVCALTHLVSTKISICFTFFDNFYYILTYNSSLIHAYGNDDGFVACIKI